LARIEQEEQGRKAMPHPKNHLKLTGDTHLPDVGDLLGEADDIEAAALEIDAQPRVYADGWMPEAQEDVREEPSMLPQPLRQVERSVERRVVSTPWLAVAAALGFGLLVARMLRG